MSEIRTCPRCSHDMIDEEGTGEYWWCSNCSLGLSAEDFDNGEPYPYEYIEDDGKPVYDDDADRSWYEDL